ncbi:hypothetical protein [Paraburkholderia megapolitana]|nr:hypothetical protein [Paraburkholderia megapolitana]
MFNAMETPGAGNELPRTNAPRGVSSAVLLTACLPSGKYNVFYFFGNGYTVLAGPTAFSFWRLPVILREKTANPFKTEQIIMALRSSDAPYRLHITKWAERSEPPRESWRLVGLS